MLYGSAVAKYPGVAFNGTYSTIMTNLSFPGDACYNAATIFFLFRTPANNFNNGQGLSFCQPSMAHPSFGLIMFLPTAHYPTLGIYAFNPTNGSAWSTLYSDLPQYGQSLSSQNVHLFSMTLLAGGYCDIFVDGKLTANTLMSDIALVPPWPAIQGGTSLGYDWLWAGTPASQESVYGLLIYTNTFSPAQMDAENTALMQRAGMNQQISINLDGDSVIFGGLANTLSTPLQLLQSNYPNCRLTCVAYPGRTSGNVLLNQTNWITTVSDPSTRIDICWLNLQNDGTTVWQQMATNMTLWCSNDMAAGRVPIPVSPWSNATTDNNGVRTNFNNWMTTNWWNIAPAMIDLSRDQLLGYVGAYANTALIPDGMHGTNASYQRIIAGYFVPTINHLLNGSFVCTSTSCVPPTVTQPWTATDPNSPGVQFVNNGGVWAPVQPANSVLTQLNSLDDYMSIDQQDPYDVATTLLPQINGNYYGDGKLAPAAGGWVFYFNPPRWPLFEWSGFTNQVLWVHIFATNSATVNWIASVRYLTNGLTSGPGSGSGGATFGTGIFQCGAGTNDYWITVTNKFPPSTMTNVTAACFFWGVNSPSTNVWVIEGTHIHAQ